MIKLALECPTSIISDIRPLTDFDFLLTHKVLQDKEYRKQFDMDAPYNDREVILDNSTNELLSPESLESIVKAHKIVCADLIVAPDFLGDKDKTIKGVEIALKCFRHRQILPVVQGSTFCEVTSCLDKYWEMGFNKVAVPYDLLTGRDKSPLDMGSKRLDIVMSLANRFEEVRIHLLGMTVAGELKSYESGNYKIDSIDTGLPILMGIMRLRLGKDNIPDKKSPTLNRMDAVKRGDLTAKQWSDIFYNIAYLRTLLGSC